MILTLLCLSSVVSLAAPLASGPVRHLPGLEILRSSGANEAPVIRGLMGSRLQLFVDGVPLNTGLWSTGPEPDLLALAGPWQRRVEVLRGPAAGGPGGDALAGVIRLRSPLPRFLDEGFDFSAGLGLGYRGASQAALGRLEVEGASSQLALRVGGDLAQYDNLRAGRGSGIQDFSSYRRGGLVSTLRYRPRPGHELRLIYRALRQLDAPLSDRCRRFDNGTVRDCQVDRERSIDLASLRYLGRAGLVWDQVDAQLYVHKAQKKAERTRRDLARLETRVDQVLSLGGRVLLQRRWALARAIGLRLRLGADLQQDLVDSEAFRKSLRARDGLAGASRGARDVGASTFVDGSSSTQVGVFAQQRLRLGRVLLDARARYSGVSLDARGEAGRQRAVQRVFSAPSGSLRIQGPVAGWLRLGAGLVHSFRAPNLYDLTARAALDGGFEFAAARGLRAERLTGVEATGTAKLGRLSVGGVVFGYLASDLIVRQPGVFAGQERLDGDPVVQRVNTPAAVLAGGELELSVRLPAHSELYSVFSYTFGQDLGHDEPLSRVPPPRGVVGARAHPMSGLKVEADAAWGLMQKRLSARDRLDPRVSAEGTPAYLVVGLGASYELARHLHIAARLHNLFDSRYRTHGSALDEPGAEGRVQLVLRF